MRQSHQIIYNSATNYGTVFFQGMISFILVPYVVTRIGKDSYGIVLIAMAAMSMAELFAAGLSKAVTKHVASEFARGDTNFINVICSSARLWFFVIGLLGATGAIVAGIRFSSLFPDVAPQMLKEGQISMFIAAGAIFLCQIGGTWRGLLAGVQRYDIINSIACLRSIFRLTFVVAYFNLVKPSLLPVLIIFASSLVFERAGLAIACYRIIPGLRLSRKFVTRQSLRMIISFASFVLVASIGNIFIVQFLQFLIGRELSFSTLTDYGIALTLMTLANTIVRGFVDVLVPVASKYHGAGDNMAIRKLLSHGTKYAVIMIIASVGVTVPFLPALYRLWMGPEYVALYGVTMIMFAGQAVASTSTCSNQILTGMGHVKFICFVMLGYVSVTISAVWLHLHFWQGATLLTTVSIVAIGRTIGNLIILGYGVRMTGAAWRNLLAHAIIKPLLTGCVVTIMGLVIVGVIQVGSWMSLVGCVLTIEALFLGGIALWCLDHEEKGIAIQFIRRPLTALANR